MGILHSLARTNIKLLVKNVYVSNNLFYRISSCIDHVLKYNVIKFISAWACVMLEQGFSTFILSFTSWQISKVKFTPRIFFIFSLLQMPIVIGKSVNFFQTKFTPKAG